MQTLQDGPFHRPERNLKARCWRQLRTALPDLALELARRLLALRAAARVAWRNCASKALEQLYPERDNLELSVSPRDAALLAKLLHLESR